MCDPRLHIGMKSESAQGLEGFYLVIYIHLHSYLDIYFFTFIELFKFFTVDYFRQVNYFCHFYHQLSGKQI